LGKQPAWLSRIMPQPAVQKGGCDMPDEMKAALDQFANSLQTVTLLASQLERDLGPHVVDASHRQAVEAVEARLFRDVDPNGPKSTDRGAEALPVSGNRT
jgi:hypothetical protein